VRRLYVGLNELSKTPNSDNSARVAPDFEQNHSARNILVQKRIFPLCLSYQKLVQINIIQPNNILIDAWDAYFPISFQQLE
jgi:hypothetical protein